MLANILLGSIHLEKTTKPSMTSRGEMTLFSTDSIS